MRSISISPRAIRRVWATLTRHPMASQRDLARMCGYSTSTIRLALSQLEHAGYIAAPRGPRFRQARAWRIIVPFSVSVIS